jgi:hypothetical protein
MHYAGDFKCDGCPDAQARPDDKGFSCTPMSSVALLPDNTLQSTDPAMEVVVRGGWRNRMTLPVIERLGIPIMHTWNQSVPLWEYHHGFQATSLNIPLLCPSNIQDSIPFMHIWRQLGSGRLCSTCCAC